MQVGPVIGALDVDPPHALDALALLVLLQVVGAPCSSSRGFQEGIVRPPPILGFVQQNVQGLLVNSGFWELHLAGREERRSLAAGTGLPRFGFLEPAVTIS